MRCGRRQRSRRSNLRAIGRLISVRTRSRGRRRRGRLSLPSATWLRDGARGCRRGPVDVVASRTSVPMVTPRRRGVAGDEAGDTARLRDDPHRRPRRRRRPPRRAAAWRSNAEAEVAVEPKRKPPACRRRTRQTPCRTGHQHARGAPERASAPSQSPRTRRPLGRSARSPRRRGGRVDHAAERHRRRGGLDAARAVTALPHRPHLDSADVPIGSALVAARSCPSPPPFVSIEPLE